MQDQLGGDVGWLSDSPAAPQRPSSPHTPPSCPTLQAMLGDDVSWMHLYSGAPTGRKLVKSMQEVVRRALAGLSVKLEELEDGVDLQVNCHITFYFICVSGSAQGFKVALSRRMGWLEDLEEKSSVFPGLLRWRRPAVRAVVGAGILGAGELA